MRCAERRPSHWSEATSLSNMACLCCKACLKIGSDVIQKRVVLQKTALLLSYMESSFY